MVTIKVAGIIKNSLVNGEGLRYVLFVSGCPHHCEGCHNDFTWDYDYGKEMDLDDIFENIKKEYPLINGVTFSGGEPMDKIKELTYLSKRIKEELGINIWCYTGYTIEYINSTDKKELLKYIDVLIDGKFQINNTNNPLKYTGSNNQRIIKLTNGEINEIITSKKE